jgi:hypothetical protein
MNMLHSLAISQLRRAGFTVLPPVPKPRAGGVWVPTRGKSEPRIVEAVSADEVVCFRGGKQRAMSLGGWHRWVQRTRAKEQSE